MLTLGQGGLDTDDKKFSDFVSGDGPRGFYRSAQGHNVELVRGTETSPELAENSIDLVIMVDVYHELSHPREIMENIVRALKPGGRFVLLEYRMEDPEVPIKRLHKMSEEQAVREMKAVGLRLRENMDNLPWQHCMVFERELP